MCSYPELDSHRFLDMIEESIKKDKVKGSKAFSAWAKKVRRQPRPKDGVAVPERKRADKENEMQLVAQIR